MKIQNLQQISADLKTKAVNMLFWMVASENKMEYEGKVKFFQLYVVSEKNHKYLPSIHEKLHRKFIFP